MLYLLGDDDVQDGDVVTHDATTDGPPLTSTRLHTPLLQTAFTTVDQKFHTAVGKHTLLHGEALLVLTAYDEKREVYTAQVVHDATWAAGEHM